MDETKLRIIAQLAELLAATPAVSFSGFVNADSELDERYAHISSVLKIVLTIPIAANTNVV